eukprot:TRINITY_DN6235_c0_g1_i1.p1 TRINITY_DN6235_c0_g1~~TRINITY_DN6235_c0_g1_i1.p1  ORF type:complete len:611 (-),score=175.83 TRINITY_DN6235_c0_g1_i1:39-1802(-)
MVSRTSLAPPRKSSIPGGSRPSLAPPRKSSVGPGLDSSRLSSAGSRKSTMGLPRASIRSDTRNVSDKAFVKKNAGLLIKYLMDERFPHQINPKQFHQGPSAKEFGLIIEFMYQKYDPNFKLTKLEDDTPTILNNIRYPFAISKRSFTSVTPHSWPPMLAALAWFAELLIADEISSQSGVDVDVEDEEKNDGTDMFFDMIARSYTSYMAGADEETPEYFTDIMANALEERHGHVRDDLNHCQAVYDELQTEYALLQQSATRIPELQSSKNHHLADIAKFKSYMASLQARVDQLQAQHDEYEQEWTARLEELTAAQQDKAQIEEVLHKQTANNVDGERIQKERALLEEGLAGAALSKEGIDRSIWDQEMAISKKMEEVEKKAQHYNHTSRRLLVAPSSAKYANGVNLTITSTTSSAHIKSVVIPALHTTKLSFVEKESASSGQLVALEQEAKARDEQMAEIKCDLDILETQLRKSQASLTRGVDRFESEVSEKRAQIESVVEDTVRIQELGACNLGKSNRSMGELTQLAEEVKIQQEAERETLHRTILGLMDALAQHKEHINGQMADLLTHFQEQHHALEQSRKSEKRL